MARRTTLGAWPVFTPLVQALVLFGAADGCRTTGSQHIGQFTDSAANIQIRHRGACTPTDHVLADVEVLIAVAGQLRQMGDDNDLVIGNGR